MKEVLNSRDPSDDDWGHEDDSFNLGACEQRARGTSIAGGTQWSRDAQEAGEA